MKACGRQTGVAFGCRSPFFIWDLNKNRCNPLSSCASDSRALVSVFPQALVCLSVCILNVNTSELDDRFHTVGANANQFTKIGFLKQRLITLMRPNALSFKPIVLYRKFINGFLTSGGIVD